ALRPGLQLLARPGRAAAHGARAPRVPRARERHGARVSRRRARSRLRGPRRAGRARRLPPGLLRRLRARPGRAQRRGRQPQPGQLVTAGEEWPLWNVAELAAVATSLYEPRPLPEVAANGGSRGNSAASWQLRAGL